MWGKVWGKCGENYTEDYTDIVIVTSCVTRVVSNDVVSCVGSLSVVGSEKKHKALHSCGEIARFIKYCVFFELNHNYLRNYLYLCHK